MFEPISRDPRLRWALRLLDAALRGQDGSQIHHAETLVISLLLPRAVALASEVTGHDPATDLERVTAARLTRAVLAWDPAVLAPDRAAGALIHEAVRPTGSDRTATGRPSGAEADGPTPASTGPMEDSAGLPRPRRRATSAPMTGTGPGRN